MTYSIRCVAVIGAGTMGAAVAAHAANCGHRVFLLDVPPQSLTPEEAAKGLTLQHPVVRNRIVAAGWKRCTESRPASLYTPDIADRVSIGNTEDNLDWLAQADWIVEAIIEKLEPKQALMARIEKVRKPGSIVSTNTSGIPIHKIADGRSDDFQAHFLGTHFFNPPRYMTLLEIIPHSHTKPEIISFMTEFCSRTLGKGVVVCKDTPNFVANRFIGVVGTAVMNYALDRGYSVEETDLLTGSLIGYPNTATFRLYDLVGIDVALLVMENLHPAIPHDPYREELRSSGYALFKAMVERKWFGNKTKQGFYKRVDTSKGKEFWVLDPAVMDYRPPSVPRFESVEKHKNNPDVGARIKELCAEPDRAGKFIWDTHAFLVNYAASVLPEIADDIVSIDNANRWGFNQKLGPFETWDAMGVAESVQRMETEGMTVTPWVKEMLATGHPSFYRSNQGKREYYDPATQSYRPVQTDANSIVLGDLKKGASKVLIDNPSGTLLDMGDGVLGLEFHTKANALNQTLFDMIRRSGEELAKDRWVAMAIGNQGAHFCAGADLNMFVDFAERRAWDEMSALIQGIQDSVLALRHSPKPVVAAPFGMVLGGGSELSMGSSAICASAELYMGQVEAGVGLVPALGGCKEPLRRVVGGAKALDPNADMLPSLRRVFEMIAMGKVTSSALEARQWGYLAPCDRIVANSNHLLLEAKRMALQMTQSGYQPPLRGKDIWAMGAPGLAVLKTVIRTMREGGYISQHDSLVAEKTAYILCGGQLTQPQWVESQYILDLEREAFISLIGEPKTLERIQHMLATGRTLRN